MADPYALAFDSASNLFVGDDTVIREFPTNGVNSIYVYTSLDQPDGLALDPAGNLYAANFSGETVEKFATNGTASALYTLPGVYGLGFDSASNLYVADAYSGAISEIYTNGGSVIFASDPGNGSVLNYPSGLVVDNANNIYVVNHNTNTIEKFTPSASPSIFASTGLNGPFGPGLAFDKAGYLYAEEPAPYPAGFSIVKFPPNGGAPTTFATDPGDGSVLDEPMGLAFDSAGNLYVANYESGTVEKFATNGTYSVFVSASYGLNGPISIVIQPNTFSFVALPTLYITLSGTNAVLSWPVSSGNFGLQASPSLASPSWTALTNTIMVNTNYVETNGITGPARYFRLQTN
jgi:DNA-binding beta-propeller fold protein YncE